jgi:hypothetical protein
MRLSGFPARLRPNISEETTHVEMEETKQPLANVSADVSSANNAAN